MSGVVLALGVAFNLTCSGTMYSDTPPTTEVFVLRIDLQQMRACYDKCERTFGVTGATKDEIVLQNGERDPISGAQIWMKINRVDGSFASKTTLPISGPSRTITITAFGKCSPGRFTGFPAAKF
ncbi:hypothetical protein [Sphingomonas asaccharolytica]|uniref:hypothetical protein n=1 Tax=Sphingomonas asaccharolytica TaxID=40681 RepID=UPI000AB29190|nr:hypothetical protein [Sphingomonas asaccharolytica]